MSIIKHRDEAISDEIMMIRREMGFTVVLGEPSWSDPLKRQQRDVYFHPHTQLLEIVARRLVPKAANNRVVVVWKNLSTGVIEHVFSPRLVFVGNERLMEYRTQEDWYSFLFFRDSERDSIQLCYPDAVFELPYDGSIKKIPPTNPLYRDPS